MTIRQHLAEAFRVAKRRLRPVNLKFICIALDAAAGQGEISYAIAQQATDIVMDRLRPHSCAEGWLRDNNWEARALLDSVSLPRAVRCRIMLQYRRRWLDSLIKEFSA